MVTVFSGALLSTHVQLLTTPEAQSPYIGPETTSRELPRGMLASGSPRSGNRLTMGGRLRVVNETPQESPTHQNRDNRGFTRLADDAPRFGMSNQGQTSVSAHGPGYRGSSGLFGMDVAPIIGRDQVARNLPVTLPASNSTTEAAAAKKSLFGWSSKPSGKIPVRARGISNPIMAENGPDNMPFSRVPTTDLATAAKNERERREAAAFARSHPLISNPVTPQEYPSPIAGPNQSAGFLRKELPYSPNERLSTVRGSISTSLFPMGAGSSTSMSVSPGREEVRRRSPRNDKPFERIPTEKPLAPARLQRNNTIGLPSGPRSQKSAAVVRSKEIQVEEDSTIMRMNNIVYNNPDAVSAIIRDAQNSYHAQQRPKTADVSLTSFSAAIKSADSMIHRPRPYSRKYSETDRALFPAEPSHRRTKSAGSMLTTRSSIFSSFPNTPAPVSTLPPLPRSAAELKKLFPSDSTGESVNEKIELLFPAPPRSLLQNRRSSVPSVPRVPSIFMVDMNTSKSRSPAIEVQPSSRASKRTTIASFVQLPNRSSEASSLGIQGGGLAVSRFSQSTVSHVANLSLEAKTFEGFHANNLSLENRPFEGFKTKAVVTPVTLNQSSTSSSPINYKYSFPIITKTGPASHARNTSITKEITTAGSEESLSSHEENASIEWVSVQPTVPPAELKQAKLNARSTFIRGIVHDNDQNFTFQAIPSPAGTESSEVTDIIPVMLDDGRTEYSSYANSMSSRSSTARNSVDLDTPINAKPLHPLFHHRLGDSLPTFSMREAQIRPRKNSVPAPLQLNRIGRPTNFVVELAELSPVESPERAIEEIMVQLENFDDSERESIDFGSLDRDTRQLQIQDRLRLLENLEKEMDEQEGQWQTLNRDRNSVSTTTTNTPANADFAQTMSTRTSRIMSYVSSRSERFRSVQVKDNESSVPNSIQSLDNPRASMWQTRLADAQLAYLENAPSLLRKSLNFLAMPSMQIASPTPPQSGESIEIELDLASDSDVSDIEYNFVSAQTPTKGPAKLWELGASSPQAAMGRLWCHPYEEKIAAPTAEPPAKNMRMMQRFNVLPLQLSSASLWTKPSLSSNPRVVNGLWRPSLVRPKSILTKRASVRPTRTNRRMTILPDIGKLKILPEIRVLWKHETNSKIVESPVPVPNKAETLGIFKFAWGETSDQPTYQPAFIPVPFSNFTVNSRLNARSMQLEPDSTEYSSSFFDDYDDENSEDSDVSSDYSEEGLENSEEEFNDNTLLQIADLLQSDAVPSRQSLFSPQTIVEDYADDSDIEESSEADKRFLQAPIRLPIPPLSYSPKPSPRFENFNHSPKPSPRYESFNAEDRYVEPDIYSASDDESLGQFEDEIIMHMEPTFETFTTQEVFSSEEDFYSDSDDGSLIDFGMALEPEAEAQPTFNKGLWILQESKVDASVDGLFSLTNNTSSIRGTNLVPQNVGFARIPRNFSTQLPQISSLNMWSKPEAMAEEKVWISASLVTITPAATPSNSLWAPTTKTDEPTNIGLFKMPAQPRSDPTSSPRPAAIDMISKTRIQQPSLPILESTNLWNGTQDLPIEHHWISESSFSPPSPSLYSPSPLTGMTTLTDRSSYDLFDTSSIRTTSTKASSLWASMSSTATPTWRDRESQSAKKPSSPLPIPDFRKSALSPSDALAAREAELNSRIPKLRRQKSKEVCLKKEEAREALRETKIVEEDESEDEGAKRAQGMEFAAIRASLRPSARRPLKPIAKPKYQRIQSSKVDWNSALSEAIAAGTQKHVRNVVSKEDWIAELNKKATIVGPVNAKKERPVVTAEAEWVAALNEAVTAGALHKPKRITVSKDDWITELNKKAIIVGPAYVKKTRPVSNEADWEAALAEAMEKSGITIKAPVVNLWTSPSALPVPSATKLWSNTPAVESTASIFDISIPNIRKALPSENPTFSILSSTTLWQSTATLASETNWIIRSIPATASPSPIPKTWTARYRSFTSPPPSKVALWTPPTPVSPTTPAAYFPSSFHTTPPKKPTTYHALQPLTSTHLFAPIPEVEKPLRTHWLLRSVSTTRPIVVTKPQFAPSSSPIQKKAQLQRSMTWSARTPSPSASSDTDGEKRLWKSTPPSKGLKGSEVFTKAGSGSEVWVRRARSVSESAVVSLSHEEKLWVKDEDEIESVKDWMRLQVE